MNWYQIFIGLFLVFASWSVITQYQLAGYVARRGMKVNFVFMQPQLWKILAEYKAHTLIENGKVGQLYYSYHLSLILLILTAIGGFLTRPS